MAASNDSRNPPSTIASLSVNNCDDFDWVLAQIASFGEEEEEENEDHDEDEEIDDEYHWSNEDATDTDGFIVHGFQEADADSSTAMGNFIPYGSHVSAECSNCQSTMDVVGMGRLTDRDLADRVLTSSLPMVKYC